MLLKFDKLNGLLPAVVQDAASGKVLMVGYMNAEALEKTLATGQVTFFSRSRNRLWVKGESSGHVLKLRDVLVDCDEDALVVVAEQLGPGTCHRGYRSCFYRRVQDGMLAEAEARAFDPEKVYGSPSGASAAEKEAGR
ncbi:MAG: phosphoribosyl-AMP cyclohydrolase [Acidobacteria bacterium]|nr:phosphoribosyl-AMP cyclohydrolase [Acidobacteriota bacterium]